MFLSFKTVGLPCEINLFETILKQGPSRIKKNVSSKLRPTIRKKNTNNLNLYYLTTNVSCEFCTIILKS